MSLDWQACSTTDGAHVAIHVGRHDSIGAQAVAAASGLWGRGVISSPSQVETPDVFTQGRSIC